MTQTQLTPELQQRLKAKLSEYNIIPIIDKTGSMGEPVTAGSTQSRWGYMQETVRDFIVQCAGVDDDGLDLVFFGGSSAPLVISKVTGDKVNEIFNGISVGGGTFLAPALRAAFEIAKRGGKKAIIPVITDGEANDKDEVIRAIIEQSKTQNDDSDLTVLFVQIGDDKGATAYLKSLDDSLTSKGAKFDIVDTKTVDEIGQTPVLIALAEAIVD